jgi:CheY-like chemotaxis protein
LTEWGCIVVGPAARVGQALKLLNEQPVDGAVLDLNIAGELVYPVADELTKRGLPYIFATGYGASGLTEPYRGQRVVEKPFARRALLQAMIDSFPRPE